MNRHEMSLILQDVRKAYRLLADYQQKICELLTFIKDEIGAEHYSYYMHNHIDPRYLYNKFYTGNENIGRGFLPMMDLHLFWQRTQYVPEGQEWQNHLRQGDLVFEIKIASDEDDNGRLSAAESTSELHIIVYQCIKYRRKVNWYADVWCNRKYSEFNQVGFYQDNSDEIEYRIYGERLDLSQMYDEERVRDVLNAFRKRASEQLMQNI